ncbi:MAG: NADP-dependent oxidoreductase [Acidimicrobiales bacterium]
MARPSPATRPPDLRCRRSCCAGAPRGCRRDDAELVTQPLPTLAEGEALMQVIYLSMDATVRTWLNRGEGYLPAVEIGEVVRCSGIGHIVATNCDAYAVGDLVYSLPGWATYGVVRDDLFTTKLDPDTPLRPMMSVFGGTGAAAYFGLLDVGKPQPGETVVVSAAGGATGSLVGQIAKIVGCRVVGIAGSDDKCAWVTEELGFDGCINHRTEDVAERLRALCPDRVDVYFDNVGGPILDDVLGALNQRGRVVLCGAIAVYNDTGRPAGPGNYLNLISRRGRMEGFITLDYWDRFDECFTQLKTWAAEGKLRWREELVDGLDRCPDALNMLFTGANTGKVLVQVVPEP